MVFDVFGCSQHEQSAVEGAQAEAGARLAQASVASIQACIEAKASVDTQCCTENFNITVAFINVIVLAVLIYYVLWLKWKTQELNPFLLPSKGYEDEYEDESLSVDHMRELVNIPTLDLTKVSVDYVIDILKLSIGNKWKFLARKLDFEETEIDAIEYGNPRDLEEQVHQLFYRWKRHQGLAATGSKLIDEVKCIRLCPHKKIALRKKGIDVTRV